MEQWCQGGSSTPVTREQKSSRGPPSIGDPMSFYCTVSWRLLLWLSVPDVAVMVMVYWPASILELFNIPELLEHPVMPCINRNPTKAHPQTRSHSFLRRRSNSIRGKRSPASIASDPTLRVPSLPLLGFAGVVPCPIPVVCIFVAMVRADVAAAVPGVTEAGLNIHDANEGSPEHASVVAAENPFIGVMLTVAVAEPPFATVALAGDSETEKSGVPVTVNMTVFEVDGALLASPA